ncbi:WD repeat-containing protein [Verticillium alfalfae VaMs.102]|uniref:WD repeat-containing protein n=1 Tax=Verticillium alfalfae (strain VaMs.102 / ATCC MYA-4576 / FGSC 10136) TaxID=526221 RepID=C9SVB9_VERA1|nr:WD repeat-containing protein [Verticillium alfalfae VaMs.102]EEY22734.1 WD repeat-containing protein [Verticillium alfalfae VaMs.102]
MGVATIWGNDLGNKPSSRLPEASPIPEVTLWEKCIGSICKKRRLPRYQGAHTKKPFHRQLCLDICTWGDTTRHEQDDSPPVGNGDYPSPLHTMETARALFRGEIGKAVQILKKASANHPELLFVSLALQLIDKGDKRLAKEQLDFDVALASKTDPYLRAISSLIATGDWSAVANQKSLPLSDRAYVAFRTFDDTQLTKWLGEQVSIATETGDIEGIVLFGITDRMVDVFAKYVGKFNDFQTATLVMSICAPRYIDDYRCTAWRNAYRAYLQRHKAFFLRTKFEVESTKKSKRDGRPTIKPPSRQIALRCVFCDAETTVPSHNGSAPPAGAPDTRNPLMVTSISAGVSCPNCGRHLPRCVVCLEVVGIPRSDRPEAAADMDTRMAAKFPTFCLKCEHVLHLDHARHWFARHVECPVPECRCKLSHGLSSLDATVIVSRQRSAGTMALSGRAPTRWIETIKHTHSLADLQRAIRYNGVSSPCLAGYRSVFLLFQTVNKESWVQTLSETREYYNEQRDHFLKFIKHPEELANVASPWNTLRQDETIRAEIAQDVQRLPEEPFYHEELTQTMIVDVLFMYCKLHPNNGGYRQGMHELLAPIVLVLHQDAQNVQTTTDEASADATMWNVVSPASIEHDAFALFDKIMRRAQAFYEVKDSITRAALTSASRDQSETSAIVEKSRHIHEVCLAKVDPELSKHLKDVEVLPQIFLMPLVLNADYSVCLMLLLKYPAPDKHHPPHTFVDDAIYLRDHLDTSGGATLVMKYTGKFPSPSSSSSSSGARPRTPTQKPLPSSPHIRASRSPLASPGRFIQQQGGVEAIFQGAAKNVLERGERLGINQAVRDAMGEIKRNVQGFNEARQLPRTARQTLVDDSATRAMSAMRERNRLLANMLEESIASLKVATSQMADDEKTRELVETAAAKVQFVKVHLEDSTIDMPWTSQKRLFLSRLERLMRSPRWQKKTNGSLGVKHPSTSGRRFLHVLRWRSHPFPGCWNPTKRCTRLQSPFPHRLSSAAQARKQSGTRGKRISNSVSRDRNAFLFGEVTTESDGASQPSTDDIFGMEPMTAKHKGKGPETGPGPL